MRLAILVAAAAIAVGSAAERHWQVGKWTAVSVQRQMIDFGPGASSFDRGRPNPATNAMADVHLYTIETDTDHLEIKDVVRVDKRSVDAVVGDPVTFAVEKNTVYVRDGRGIDHKLRLVKRTSKPR